MCEMWHLQKKVRKYALLKWIVGYQCTQSIYTIFTQIYVSLNRLEETDPHRKYFSVFFLNDIGEII